METVALKLLFIGGISAQFGKHVYVSHNYGWYSAQTYCRNHHTDLSPITSAGEENRLKSAASENITVFWIGLYRNMTNQKWMWSGGGHATYTSWDADEPDNSINQVHAAVCWSGCNWNGWHVVKLNSQLPFFCFNLILKESKKSWEKAMWHCKKTHTSLTSLTSETEHLLALKKIQDHITDRVWIGLRYLGDTWLWVDGYPMRYQAWPEGDQDHQCPTVKHCGALNKRGVWESRDCMEQLHFICY